MEYDTLQSTNEGSMTMASRKYEVEFKKDKNFLDFLIKDASTKEKVRNFTLDLQEKVFYGVNRKKPLVQVPSEYKFLSERVVSVAYSDDSLSKLWKIICATCYTGNISYINLAEKWLNVGIEIPIGDGMEWTSIPFTKESIKFFKEKNEGLLDYTIFQLRESKEKLENLQEVYPFESGSRYDDTGIIRWFKSEVLLNDRSTIYSNETVRKWIYKMLMKGLGYGDCFSTRVNNYLMLYRAIYGDDYSHLGDNVYTDYITLKRHSIYSKFLDCDKKLAERKDLIIPQIENNSEYTIITPKSVEDFRRESEQQGNCVLSHYCKRVADGETEIYFVRYKGTPNKSFITMEINNGRVTTILGKGNTPVSHSIAEYLVQTINKYLR